MSQRRVLLIERDAEIVQTVLGFLNQGGDVAEHATNTGGLQNGGALPDVVVVRAELHGPGGPLQGCDMADGIKSGERTSGLPVVLYSADPLAIDAHRSGNTPADAYLSWPFSADVLLDQIHLLTDGAALAAPLSAPEVGDEHLIAEEVPADGELEQLFNTPLPPPGEAMAMARGSEDPTVSNAELPQISADLIEAIPLSPPGAPEPEPTLDAPPLPPLPPLPAMQAEPAPAPVQSLAPEPDLEALAAPVARATPLPESDNLARTLYDPLPVGLQPETDEPVGAAPALQAADAELQELVAGLDAAALETTREVPAVDESELDALAEAAILPEAPPPPPQTPEPAPMADSPSLDAAVEAEFGVDLPPPPPPAPATPAPAPATPAPAPEPVVAAPVAAPPPAAAPPASAPPPPAAAAHNAQKVAALEAAGQAARAAKEQAEAASAQVEEMAVELRSAKDEAAVERARASELLESLEAERVRAAALEQDVVRLDRRIEENAAVAERAAASVAEAAATAAAAEGAREAAVRQASAHAGQLAALTQRAQADDAVFERVTKAVRIAAAILDERDRNK